MEKKTYVKAAAEVVRFASYDTVSTEGCGGRNSAGYGSGIDGDYGEKGSGATAWGSYGC